MGSARRRKLRDARGRAGDVLDALSFRDRELRVRDEALSFGLLAYLLSFLVLPALHLSDHAPDHDHGDDAAGASHAGHGPGPHHHGGDRPGAPLPAPAHGHGTSAHFAVAFSAVTPFVFLPMVRPFTASACLAASPAPAHGIPVGCAKPRGPPRVG